MDKTFIKTIKNSWNRMILILFFVFPAVALAQQSTTVTGVVKSESGEALPGVVVKIKGGNSSTQTDANGKYTIAKVDNKTILVFTYLGFAPREEAVGKRTVIDVVLKESLNALQEVVVVGYGETVAKRDLTGAISTVSAKQVKERPSTNLVDALQSLAAGVQVTSDDGAPGATGSIRIRGNSTFSSAGNEPLYVIDGILSENADNLNPADIQSIEVLKDAASAAIYGSRSANGVILITTKRGLEGKPRIDAQFTHLFGEMAHKILQSNADLVRLFRQKQSPNNANAGFSTDSLNPGFNADNDYQDLITRTANRDIADLSVSGGQKGLDYYSSLRLINDQGLIVNSHYKSVQARININYQASKKFKYSNRIAFNYNTTNNINEGNTINQTLQRPTNFAVYLPDGSLTGYVSGRRNPLTVALYELNQTDSYSGNFFNEVQYDIFKDLKFTTNFNVNLSLPHNVFFDPKILSSNNPLQNNGRESYSLSSNWAYQSFLNYSKTIHKDHQITALAGFSAEKWKYNSFRIAGNNYASESVFTSNSAANIDLTKTGTDGSVHSLASFFGKIGYNYKGKYITNFTFRRDGSSRFGKDKPWADFFSGSAAWRFSEEKFMSWAKNYLEDGKLRLSLGQNGNERIGDFDALQTYNFGSSFYNGVNGVVLNDQFGNSQLQWETTTQKDVGLDLSFLKGRLGITADYYNKTTKDLLYQRNIPKETGFSSVRVNVGDIGTKGVEFAVNATPIANNKFTWNVVGNISFERNSINHLFNGQSFLATDSRATYLIREGGKLGDFYGYQFKGVYAYDQSNAYNDNFDQLTPVFDNGVFKGYTFNGQPYTGTVHHMYSNGVLLTGGDAIFENVQRDSVIDANDQKILGNAQPNFYAGLVNTFGYKQFSFSFTFNTSWGGKIYNGTRQILDDYSTSHIIPEPYVILNAWTQQGDVTDVPEISRRKKTGNFPGTQSRFIEDASFIRLSYAKFTFTLPDKIARKMYMRNLGLFAYGSNLLTWTNYSGFDPEFSSSNALTLNYDSGRYPRRREFGIGLNANF